MNSSENAFFSGAEFQPGVDKLQDGLWNLPQSTFSCSPRSKVVFYFSPDVSVIKVMYRNVVLKRVRSLMGLTGQ